MISSNLNKNNKEVIKEDNKIQYLAYYLPQYHPIPENDKWWGKGFTEWTNVAKAKPLFKGHYQPILPGELGFYDLRVPEVQQRQAELAKEYGVDGFIYYQYWFGKGKMLLEKPAEAMLKNKNITLPFCFCWANETWKGIWHGLDNPEVLIEQTYEGIDGYTAYFEYLLPFFKDERYIKVENKPMFHVYNLHEIPDLDVFLETFNTLSKKNGFDGIYMVATKGWHPETVIENELIHAVVGLESFQKMRYDQRNFFSDEHFLHRLEIFIKYRLGYTDNVGKRRKPLIIDYAKGVRNVESEFCHVKYIPCVFPNWDNSARSGLKSMIFKNATPESWKLHLEKTINQFNDNPNNPKYIIIKSWNEWAEGNYLEPDMRFGLKWLEVLKNVK